MFIELVETLRCPREHADTWLVASINRLEGRHIVDGSLGCPLCRAQFPILDGVVDMSLGSRQLHLAADDVFTTMVTPDDDDVARAAALLDLSEPGGTVALAGAAAKLAAALEAIAQVHVLLVSPTDDVPWALTQSVVRGGGGLPVAAGALKAVLVDAASATPVFLDAAQRALAPGGRLVAPAAAPVPSGVRILARDAREWVAVRPESPGVLVPLHRR